MAAPRSTNSLTKTCKVVQDIGNVYNPLGSEKSLQGCMHGLLSYLDLDRTISDIKGELGVAAAESGDMPPSDWQLGHQQMLQHISAQSIPVVHGLTQS